ncbi:MAG: hypothetical protein GWO87_00630 [Xanthomonadaceae bacterium]|nr:hypothetical protein [Rhodospirillaceae bacterium]NIA17685.1 hypothetical protein [Xanthomonadaceae bacterium]
MFKKIQFFIILLLIISFCSLNFVAVEAITVGGLQDTATQAGLSKKVNNVSSFSDAIGNIIRVFLSFLGIIFFILVIYGGFIWMTAGGNNDKVETAKKIIINATLGLIIVLSAYVITYIITNELNLTVSKPKT